MVEFHHPEDDKNFGPLALAREVHKRVMEGGDHKISTSMAMVTINDNQFGGYQFSLGFHESQMNAPFMFRGTSQGRFRDDSVKGQMTDMEGGKHSQLGEFTDDVAQLADILREAYNLNEWEFSELDAASIGGMGGLTDYEFKFETGTTDDNFSRDAIDNAIERMQRF